MKIQKLSILFAFLFVSFFYSCEKEKDTQLFPASEFISKGSYSGDYWPTEGWRTCKPEDVGMNSDKLKELNDEILLLLELHIDINSVIIVRKGYIVAEQYYSGDYGRDSLHMIYSCTKSITSALLGIAIEQGYISSENAFIMPYFPEYKIENLSEGKNNITLKHMLTMSAGFEWNELNYLYGDERNTFNQWASSVDRVKFVLDRPMDDSPGERWNYNTGISHVLSAIIKKSTGMRTDSFAVKNIFNPLGINNFYWPVDQNGVANGGNGVKLLPRDMAKFGYLYLRNGKWEGNQIVPELWVEISHQKQIERGPNTGNYYGFHWWVNNGNSYSAIGYAGQWITIVPDHDLVVIFTNQFTEGDDFQWGTAERLMTTYILPSINDK